MKKKLAIIGASYLQAPLIQRAKELGIETHVFAWATGDIGEQIADHFYPISIVEKEQILEKCRLIGIHGICSIASDLATIAVNYVANQLGLNCNSMESSYISTNKHAMRTAFEKNGDPSPVSRLVSDISDLETTVLQYPIIVKPVDRSGSRGITKLESPDGLEAAIAGAKEQSFQKAVVVEEFVTGTEYSVECISMHGVHTILAVTRKYTTDAPHFIETAHIQPSGIDEEMLPRIRETVYHALNSLKISNGASHTELKINKAGEINLIEIGARMGGDFIGSDLVFLSTGVDFVEAVIRIALNETPAICPKYHRAAAVRFIFSRKDVDILAKLELEHPEILVRKEVGADFSQPVTDSSTRHGYFLMQADSPEILEEYLK